MASYNSDLSSCSHLFFRNDYCTYLPRLLFWNITVRKTESWLTTCVYKCKTNQRTIINSRLGLGKVEHEGLNIKKYPAMRYFGIPPSHTYSMIAEYSWVFLAIPVRCALCKSPVITPQFCRHMRTNSWLWFLAVKLGSIFKNHNHLLYQQLWPEASTKLYQVIKHSQWLHSPCSFLCSLLIGQPIYTAFHWFAISVLCVSFF